MNRSYLPIAVSGAVILGLAVGIWVSLRPDHTEKDNGPDTQGSSSIASNWEPFRTSTELSTCKRVLESVNYFLSRKPEALEVHLPKEEREAIVKNVKLSEPQLEELQSGRFTPLDAHHLELCFLLRDAANALTANVDSASGKEDAADVQLARAELAFHWVMREVAIRPIRTQLKDRMLNVPAVPLVAPEVVLRFGEGAPLNPAVARGVLGENSDIIVGQLLLAAPLQRANVFLLLLQQLGIDGCLIGSPKGDQQRYWACGAVINEEVYLFDPRLALPIPGPGGKGIATLKQLRANPEILDVLKTGVKDQVQYDVTAEDIKQAKLQTFASLSALSGRMRSVEKSLRDHAILVHLHVDLPAMMDRVEKAWQASGAEDASITHADWSLQIQSGFYPKVEGGTGNGNFAQTILSMIVPREVLTERVPRKFMGNVGVSDVTNNILLSRFVTPFQSLHFDSDNLRSYVLRGRYSTADRGLGKRSDDLELFRERYEREDKGRMDEALVEWGRQTRAAIAEGGKTYKSNRLVETFFDGVAAEELLARVRYLGGLSHQEKAERLLYEWEHAPVDQKKRLLDAVLQDWRATRSSWVLYYRKHDGHYLSNTARWQLARSQQVMARLLKAKAEQEPRADLKKKLLQSSADAHDHSLQLWEELALVYEGLLRLHCQYQAHLLESSADGK